MKIIAIVAEFNPLHNGHKRLIDYAKSNLGADYVVIIMSGDYVQRGAPAIFDKYTRTDMALQTGADLVLELPVHYSTSSAEYFAGAAVAMADKLGIVTHLLFGSECGNVDTLSSIADVLIDEPESFKITLQNNLKLGYSYPAARHKALLEQFENCEKIISAINNPNNILGIEYIKAIKKRRTSIIPLTLLREGAGYHNHTLDDVASDAQSDSILPSALAIRSELESKAIVDSLRPQLPEAVYSIIDESYGLKRGPMTKSYFSLLLYAKLLERVQIGYEEFADVSAELSTRIQNELKHYQDFEQFCGLIKTKNITYTRISRALIHILLGIRQSDIDIAVSGDYIGYAAVLGFRRHSKEILTCIKNTGSLVLLTKNANSSKLLTPEQLCMFMKNIEASMLYEAVLHDHFGCKKHNMYQLSPKII